MSGSEARSAIVLELVEEFLERYRQGQRPALTEYIDRHPELANEIREVFPAMAMMENIAIRDESLAGELTAAETIPVPVAPRAQLGDFRIIREIGHGGMGIVYEAEQVSLGRHVALKILPQQMMRDPRQRRRFDREAKAAAKLHHTNIVPVFGVGEHEGTPYYAMQFIQGLGLDEVLEEVKRLHIRGGPVLSQDGRKPIARDGQKLRPAADVTAADVAHSLLNGWFESGHAVGPVSDPNQVGTAAIDETAGASTEPSEPANPSAPTTSHRPVHPSSSVVLPGQSGDGRTPRSKTKKATYWQSVAHIGLQVANALEYAHKQGILHRDIKPSNLLLDTSGTVWVADFGLAKADDQQNLTYTGDVLGTLRYMPPEAFEGKSDLRGDIYSLGLTLYELLAFRSAFDEKDRNKLIKQVTHEEPPRLKSQNPQVPRDLETIVHKAIDRESSHRYPTALELALDLQRFLDDEPIQARRISPFERLARWSRQNKGLAAALGALTLTLAGVTVASTIAAASFQRIAHEKEAESFRAARSELKAIAGQKREVEQREKAEAARASAEAAQTLAEAPADTIRHNLYYAQMNLAQQAWQDVLGPLRMEGLLDAWRTDDPRNDLRGWEWYYLESLRYKYRQVLRGHDEPVTAVAFGPGSRQIASGGQDGTLRAWDAVSGAAGWSRTGPAGVHALAWDTRADRLAAALDDGTIHILDPRTGRTLATLRGRRGPINALSWEPNGPRLASSAGDATVEIWDLSAGTAVVTIRGHTAAVSSLDWSPDGTRLASAAGDQTIRIWSASTGEKRLELANPKTLDPQVQWSPDGKLLASTSENSGITFWEADTGKKLKLLKGHAGEILALRFSRDGTRLASAGWDGAVRVWDSATGQEVLTLRGHTNFINALCWDHTGGSLASASDDQTVRIWDATREQDFLVLRGHDFRISCVAWDPAGRRLATSSWDRTVKLWDAKTGRNLATLMGHTSYVRAVGFSPDGRSLASAGADKTVRIWDVPGAKEVAVLQGHTGDVQGVCWHPDGRRAASASLDGTIRVWNVPARAEQLVLKGQSGGSFWACWSPDGARLASAGNEGQVEIWEAATGRPIISLHAHPTGAYAVCWSPDGKQLATGGFDQVIKLWDAGTWREIATLHGHTDLINSLSWSPDGARLASSSRDHHVKIWDPLHAREIVSLRTHTNQVPWVAWSPDGARLATASHDYTVHIHDAGPGYKRAQRTALESRRQVR